MLEGRMEPEIGPGIVWAKHRYLFHFIAIKKYTLKGRLDREYSELNLVFYLPDFKKYTLKRNTRSDPPTGLQILCRFIGILKAIPAMGWHLVRFPNSLLCRGVGNLTRCHHSQTLSSLKNIGPLLLGPEKKQAYVSGVWKQFLPGLLKRKSEGR